jgi:hypothetical protein
MKHMIRMPISIAAAIGNKNRLHAHGFGMLKVFSRILNHQCVFSFKSVARQNQLKSLLAHITLILNTHNRTLWEELPKAKILNNSARTAATVMRQDDMLSLSTSKQSTESMIRFHKIVIKLFQKRLKRLFFIKAELFYC